MRKTANDTSAADRGLPGNRLDLDDGRACYRVTGGDLDVFLVQAGNGAGARHFLFTATTGDILCGVPSEATGTWRFLAMGPPETRVVLLGNPSEQAARAASGPAVDNWLANLTAALIGQPILAAKTGPLLSGATVDASAGARLVADTGVVWASLEAGKANFLDEGPGFGPIEADSPVPVSGRAWISVVEDARISATDSAGLAARGMLDGALLAFHRRLVAALAAEIAAKQECERKRLEERSRRDHAAISQALSKVVSVLRPDKRNLLLAADTQDPLLAACRLVAKAAHVDLDANAVIEPGANALERVNAFAVASGFRVRRTTLDKDWYESDCGPLLVFYAATGAPAAALPRKAGRYDLYDPTSKCVVGIDKGVADGLSPEACMFYAPFPDRPLSGRDLLAFALRGQRGDLLMILAMGALAALLGLLTPIMTEAVISTAIPDAATGMLTQIGALLLVCTLASGVFSITKGIAILRVEGKLDAHVQSAVIDRLLSLPAAFFKAYTAGDLASRCLGINAIHTILSGLVINALLTVVFSLFNLALLFYYDWQLAVLANAFVAANMVLVGLVSIIVLKKQRVLMDLQGRKQGMELEYLTGICKLRLTGSESRAFGAWADVYAKASTLSYQCGRSFNLVSAVNAAFPTLASMALFFWFFQSRLDLLGLGGFLAFSAAFAAFQVAMIQFTSLLSKSLAVVPLYERAKPILSAFPEANASIPKPGKLRGEIEINHVVFRYQPEGRPVLNDLSIHIAPGEFVALAGDSGAGKSTVLRLLLGFETPQSGTVYYDGQDLRELDVRALRQRIGVVLQDDKPMAGSLFDNIVGSANLGIEEVWEAARMVGLEEDIKAMPMGMQTVVPPGGASFSGGQIQRLLIARALVRRPGILLFDEATSALDNVTQAVVSRSIASLKVTRLVIAHRLSTVMGADTIYVLRHGQVAEVGTYGELMAKKGYFYELAKRQIA
ncbi:NHLP bacteriocin export ABC transporter permease/ATPase subunit [Fundidesulfovibrio butyratiphilus]